MLQSLISGLLAIIPMFFNFLQILILLSVVISWVNADPYNPYVQLIRRLTEPMYRPIRRWTDRVGGPFDLAPLVLIFILVFLQNVLYTYLKHLYSSF
jgi:YggT family protein